MKSPDAAESTLNTEYRTDVLFYTRRRVEYLTLFLQCGKSKISRGTGHSICSVTPLRRDFVTTTHATITATP